MGRLGGAEWLIIILLVVLLFGAKRLPDAARGVGRSLRIFKAETKGLIEDGKESTSDAGATAPPSVQSGTVPSGTVPSSLQPGTVPSSLQPGTLQPGTVPPSVQPGTVQPERAAVQVGADVPQRTETPPQA